MSDPQKSACLYLVQHGEAVAESVDPNRPLSGPGRVTVEQVAAWAAWQGVKVDQIRHSGKLRAEQTAAISSSAWNVRTPKCLSFVSSCRISLAGVIGYVPRNSSLPLHWAAATRPQESAWLPMMFR